MHIKKRILSMLLACLLMVGIMPVGVLAADDTHEKEIQSAVAEMIEKYAKKVYRANADDDAFDAYFKHAIFGNGKKMTLNEKSAQTAALFNSNVLQEALTVEIAAAILKMQELRRDVFYGSGATNWHNYLYSYYSAGYLYKGETYSGSVGALVQANTSVDTYYHYTGSGNENDEVQELLSGGLNTSFELIQKNCADGMVTYDVTIILTDTFDFTGSYDDIAEQGYNTSRDEALKDLGFLMTFMGLDEFDWSFKTTLQVEVPFYCEHITHNYRWVYRGADATVHSDGTNGYTYNNAEQRLTSKGENGGIDRYHHKLEKSVLLTHNRPWVIEWDQTQLRGHQFGPSEYANSAVPTIHSNSQHNVWLVFQAPMKLKDGTTKFISHYLGVETDGKFEYNRKHKYTTTLENVVNADGSNMIYVSLYDHDVGEVVFGPEPMDNLWYALPGEEEKSLRSDSSKLANGMDIIINYIGTKSCGLSYPETVLELRIWENGKEPSNDMGVVKKATCTEQGGNYHECSDCGGGYFTDPIPALGHSYGEYVNDNNPGCMTDATKTRVCTRCGNKDSVELPDTALGHTFGDYSFNNNATCTADGTQTRTCSVCGEKETVTAGGTALGHSYNAIVTEPTLTEQGYTTYTCTVCGDSYKDDYTDKKEHKYVPVVTEPTCIAKGYTTYTCSECGDTYVADYTEMAEHTPVVDPAVAPTCVEKGKTEGSHCGVCGEVLKKQANISTVDRHSYTEEITKVPTYDEAGEVIYTCSDCGKVEVKVVPPFEKPTANNPFTDVAETDWFYEPVLWALQEDVTKGKTETTFAPYEGCTRAQVVTFLWAANGKPEPVNTNNPFIDIGESDWYYNAVLWAVEQGITTGISETAFGPEQTCTRAQIATFLWAANGRHAVTSESTFVDVAGSEWYATPVIWAVENEVTSGIGEGKFGPEQTCTRAQVVTFLYKVYG